MSLLDKVYKSRKTIIEMMEDRGVNMEKFRQYSINEIELMISSMHKSNKDMSPIDMTLDNIMIKYVFTPKLRITHLITLATHFIENFKEGDTIIFIIRDKITSEESIEEFFDTIFLNNKIFIQYFYLDTLTFNVTHHTLVPNHTILTEEEADNLVKSLYIINRNKLPKIKKTDPISKYYGIKPGQIFRIERPSETSGISYYYRLCE